MATALTDTEYNWLGIATLVSTICLWLFGLLATLAAMVFKTRMDALEHSIAGKLDHEAVSDVIEESIERYHERFVKEFKRDSDRKHQENSQALLEIRNLLMKRP